jgi:hypothetical protein
MLRSPSSFPSLDMTLTRRDPSPGGPHVYESALNRVVEPSGHVEIEQCNSVEKHASSVPTGELPSLPGGVSEGRRLNRRICVDGEGSGAMSYVKAVPRWVGLPWQTARAVDRISIFTSVGSDDSNLLTI